MHRLLWKNYLWSTLSWWTDVRLFVGGFLIIHRVILNQVSVKRYFIENFAVINAAKIGLTWNLLPVFMLHYFIRIPYINLRPSNSMPVVLCMSQRQRYVDKLFPVIYTLLTIYQWPLFTSSHNTLVNSCLPSIIPLPLLWTYLLIDDDLVFLKFPLHLSQH